MKEDSSLNENKKGLAGGGSQNLPKGLETATDDSKKSKGNKNNDPHLQEFLKVMQPRAKSKIWADDAVTGPQLDQDGKAEEEEAQPLKAKKKQNNKENKLTDETSSSPPREGCSETISMKKADAACAYDISDMDYFKSRVKKNWSDSESDDEGSHDEGLDSMKTQSADLESNDHTVEMEEASVKGSDVEGNDNKNPMMLTNDSNNDFETGRLFIRNLPYTTKYVYSLKNFSLVLFFSFLFVVPFWVKKLSKCCFLL